MACFVCCFVVVVALRFTTPLLIYFVDSFTHSVFPTYTKKTEFNSKVADMKNSVKDRGNAQSSCAGHFIEAHLDEEYKGGWLHIDMAGPSLKAERGTGYGVGLILSLLEAPGF